MESPWPGVVTWTVAVRASSTSAAEIAAVSRLALTQVVGRWNPFHSTREPVAPSVKPSPSTTRTKAASPAFAWLGVRLPMVAADAAPAAIRQAATVITRATRPRRDRVAITLSEPKLEDNNQSFGNLCRFTLLTQDA